VSASMHFSYAGNLARDAVRHLSDAKSDFEQDYKHKYGSKMTLAQVASELGLSETTMKKKLGYSRFEHLPWVLPIRNARVRPGRNDAFSTIKVAAFAAGDR